MDITIEGVGDVELEPGTTLGETLRLMRAPAAVWCGGARLDASHRAGVPPLVAGALLSTRPGRASVPPTGPHLRVVAGPDAGGVVEAVRDAVVVGRDGPLGLDDPRLSRRHLALDAAGRARDLGSRNGTMLVRGGRRRRLGRLRRRLRHGDLLLAGGSALRWTDPGAASEEPRPPTRHAPRLGPMLAGLAGGAAGGLALGVATGRWELAAVALAAPLAFAVAAAARARVPPEPVPVGSERLADLPLPVAVRGDAVSAQAAARALALGHAAALPAPLDEPWTRWLARRLDERAVTLTAGAAPSEARTVLDVGDGTVAVDGRVEPWQPSLVSAATAETLARAHASRGHVGLPREVRWAELSRPEPSPGRLLATLGRGDDGDVTLDLDADGPHLLVAGTTGAGKSALLETLVTGLAHDHAPTRLAIALIDLKGGAGLGACAALPHSRGLLTDLEPSAARRALLGLAHELRARKELLASAGSTSWTDLGSRGGDDEPPPRLLVVIDEFQELGGMDPGFLPELARLAAQGRSLGMHLVLATQRPAGVVTPDIRANVATVIALRTASAAESQDLLGDASAAALPADAPGRAIVATGTVRRTMQAALPLAQRRAPARKRGASGSPGPSLASAAAARWDPADRPSALWLPALRPGAVPPPGALGWCDLPTERAQEPLVWDPRAGALAIVGPRGSGRSTALDAVAAALPGCVRLPTDAREAARTLALVRRSGAAALLVDDVERVCAALDPLLRGASEALEALARDVPVALAGGPAWGARWASRAGLRIVMSGLDRVEQTLWGVPSALLGLSPEPGRGVAVTSSGAAECRIGPATPTPCRVLVRPLVCPPDLDAPAVGVIGDDAAPWRPGPGSLLVVAAPGTDPAPALHALARARTEVTVSARVDPAAATVVIVDPTPARLRELGVDAPPGVAEPLPPVGRVAVLHGRELSAAQLRLDAKA